uniref:ribonuclease Z n=1 Tax=Flavobacterium sp. TaxID=239 RepID=UPI004049AEFE
MKINILGCYAATPRTLTNPTSQVLEIQNELFLIDCGEGTQVQLRKHKIKFSKINHVFISHLHGDHFFGLVGLISTFSLLNRQNDLHIYGPKGIKEIILLQLKLSESYTGYGLYFHELTDTTSQVIYENDKLTVKTIPLNHRVYTNGFLFEEKTKPRKININAINDYDVETCYLRKIKQGFDGYTTNGELVKNKLLTFEPEVSLSYAFCSDTVFDESIVPIIKNTTVLYHESTFLESEKLLATKTKHSTAQEAATIAQKAAVNFLILGHYSTRYPSLKPFQEEAKTVFEATYLGDDAKSFELKINGRKISMEENLKK